MFRSMHRSGSMTRVNSKPNKTSKAELNVTVVNN